MQRDTSSDGEKAGNETKTNMVLSYLFTKDSTGLYDIKMNYDRFQLHVKALDQEKEIDADNAAGSFDPVTMVLAAFRNASIGYMVDGTGKVKDISGFKELSSEIYKLAGGNPDSIQLLQTSVSQYTDSKSMQSRFEGTFKLLPDSVLKEGDSWILTEPVTSDIYKNVETKYKVKSIKNGVITITANADIDIASQPMMMERTQITTTLEGNQSGEIKIEASTGMLISSTSNLKLKGNILVMGQTIPMKLSMKNTASKLPDAE